MKKTLGFSLVELLIAGAILGIILTVLTNLFVSSSRASERVDEVSDQQQEAHATRQVLQYEIGLAGYRGILNDTAAPSTSIRRLDNRTFANTVVITRHGLSSQPDTLTVLYYEDRNYNGSDTPELRTITYSIGSDNGVSSLFRKQGSATAVGIIPNVTNLKIAEYVFYEDSGEGSSYDSIDLAKPNNLAGLELDITYANQHTDTLLITFQNAQTVSVN